MIVCWSVCPSICLLLPVCRQVGMVADYLVESQRIVTICDAADLDESKLPDLLADFEAIIYKLFVKGQVIEIPGLTTAMIEMLRTPRTYLIHGVVKTIGAPEGVPDRILTKCRKRMSAIVALAGSVCRAEFPDFDLMSSFRVFTLGNKLLSRKKAVTKNASSLLDRLARSLKLDALELRAQFAKFQPLASKLHAQGTHSTFAAWSEAVMSTQKTATSRQLHPAEVLVQALARFGAWSSSSSDVERGFSLSSSLRGGQSEDIYCAMEEAISILKADRSDSTTAKSIVSRAADIWNLTYGKARARTMARFDKGLPGKLRKTGEAHYVRTRSNISASLLGKAGRLLPCHGDINKSMLTYRM